MVEYDKVNVAKGPWDFVDCEVNRTQLQIMIFSHKCFALNSLTISNTWRWQEWHNMNVFNVYCELDQPPNI